MRMQLKNIYFAVLLAFPGICPAVFAQDSSKVKLEDIEVNFLYSYYQQDGNHSPVTGGRGTEKLDNNAPSLNINIPIDSSRSINIDGGVDFYSSASSDNINNPYLNPNHVSGASGFDERSYAYVTYKKKKGKIEKGITGGASFEWDVFSYSAGVSWSINSKDKNRSFGFKSKYFFDDWKLIYPMEHRIGGVEYLPTDKRHSVNTSFIYSTHLGKRLTALIAWDFVYQNGILSTPFHRVYFQGVDQLDATQRSVIERLPGQRMKYPLGVRLNYHVTNFMILKGFYRYYADSWGLTGHTFELTVPLKVSQSLRLYPFYRFNQQNQAMYFAPYQVHSGNESYYTSDFDLSTFTSHKYGMGMSYAPLFGLAEFKYFKGRKAQLKSIGLRYANYRRSDGLRAGVVTFGAQFMLKR